MNFVKERIQSELVEKLYKVSKRVISFVKQISVKGLACEQAHLWVGYRWQRSCERNGARKGEPARELLIFEFPAFADERSDLIG